MLSGSFKYFFAVTGLDLGPIGLALLAHIYGEVAICKSCENSRRRTSQFRLSPGKQRFRSSTTRALRRGRVTVPEWSPTEITTSGWPADVAPASQGLLLNTPQDVNFLLLEQTITRPTSIASGAMPARMHTTRRPETIE
jgi:hypothetical protein